jgi:hypothetical protein
MSALGAGRPLLLKNPGYTAQIGAIRALWPNARFVHIYRNPYVVFESTRRALRTVLRELALQSHEHVPIDEVVLALYPRMMSRLLEEVDRLPSRAIVHVASRSSSGIRSASSSASIARSNSETMQLPGPASKPTCSRSTTTGSRPTPSRKRASDGSPNAGSHS